MRDEYVADLLRARPKGPHNSRVSYTTTTEYDYRKHKDITTPIPSDEQWGYTDEQLFGIGFTDRDDVQKYVLERWFPGKATYQLGRKKATVTRRVNRLWERLEDVIRRVTRTGGTGIYHVRTGYYKGANDFGHIFATSPEEAKRFANMFFSYLLQQDERVKVEFVRFGTPHEVIILNAQHHQDSLRRIKGWESEITTIKEKIETQMTRLETLTMIEQQQLSAESVS